MGNGISLPIALKLQGETVFLVSAAVVATKAARVTKAPGVPADVLVGSRAAVPITVSVHL